jgi:hypothetical protein
MSPAAEALLAAFDALPAADRHAVVVELLARHQPSPDIPDAAYAALADESFLGYDNAAATGDATRPSEKR